MGNLAIKGHATRGKEVIEILKMLGGINTYKINYTEKNLLYCLREGDNVIIATYPNSSITKVFTIERFLEKYPYKVGDKVSILDGTNYVFTIKSMTWDTDIEQVVYKIKAIDDIENEYDWLADELLYYTEQKEEPMENKGTIDLTREETKAEEIEVILGDYEFVLKNGKTYFVKTKPKYPKTFVDCCEILYPNENFQTVSQPIKGHNGKKLFVLQKLLICRDAYWKIAGDLEPNWEDETDIYYTISYDGVNIKCYNNTDIYSKLAFPTSEMRDAFYENFKELIEQCKEFL
jgi:hypothetical protein